MAAVKLPEQEYLDGVEGKLATLTDAIDGVQVLTMRAGIARQLAEQAPDDSDARAAHEAMVRDLGGRWPDALAGLLKQIEVAEKWVRKELASVRG